MDLGNPPPVTRSQTLLAELRDGVATQRDLRIAEVRRIAEWAALHVVDEESGDAATITERGLDTGLPVAGEGAPLISDFAVMELGAHLERGLDSARNYVGQVVELAYRLPRIWAEVLAGRVPVWKALRTADFTRPLSPEGAAFVDRQLARFATTCTWTQIERLVEEAIARFDPELAEARREAARDRRRFDIDLDHGGIDGTTSVDGVLDTVDALDLEAAVADLAAQRGRLGDTDALGARRAKALGDLARGEWTLDLTGADSTEPRPIPRPAKRTIHLHLHLSTAALEGASNVGRLAETRSPVLVEQLKEWLGAPGATILLRPVIDVAGCERVDAYEIPDVPPPPGARARRDVRVPALHAPG